MSRKGWQTVRLYQYSSAQEVEAIAPLEPIAPVEVVMLLTEVLELQFYRILW